MQHQQSVAQQLCLSGGLQKLRKRNRNTENLVLCLSHLKALGVEFYLCKRGELKDTTFGGGCETQKGSASHIHLTRSADSRRNKICNGKTSGVGAEINQN
jgi:hypothetical protein